MDTADLKTHLDNCRAPQYTRVPDLRPGIPYRIVKLDKSTTRYGEAITATLEELVGDNYFMRAYLPQRFLRALSDAVIKSYNTGEGCSRLTADATNALVLADHIRITHDGGRVRVSLTNQENGAILNGELGITLNDTFKKPKHCEDGVENCLEFGPDLRFTVTRNRRCYQFNWTSKANISIEDCFGYGSDLWYGGPENTQQYWPFSNMTFNEYSYITKEDGAQAVAERYWLTSSGYYIFVDRSVPLFIDSNNHMKNGFCMIAKQSDPYLSRGGDSLSYKVCAYRDARVAHKNAVKKDLGRPTGLPDQRMVRHPIWSTWVRCKKDVNDTAVRAFAKEIVDYGFNNSQIEIDDNWETCYGSAQFNKSRFPNMTRLGTDLNAMGFRVTLWNHPFVNTNCPLFTTLEKKGYLIKDQEGNTQTTWWDGDAGVVDFTNPSAAQWYVNRRLTLMKNNKIDSVKMDAGESSFLPQIPRLNASAGDQPNAFSAAYVRAVAELGNMIEVRSGHRTQDLPIFVRMLDKDSKWTFDNGLPTLLTTLFQMNLNGYTFVLPDMVGGNAYNTDVVTKELFIRWLQATTFMPAVQFSAAPWDFDNETVKISQKFTTLHYEYSGKIIRQMRKCVKSGDPVNMPVWWVAPTDKNAQAVWSEYLLGEDILVAPVVEKGAVTRDIYLPQGRWRDEADSAHKVYRGKRWLRDYPAPLDTLPYFTRVGKE